MALYKELVKKESISSEKKVKQKEYISQECLPIVDQGNSLIGGYSNDKNKELTCKLPVIVFGDHTKAVKYVDFPFGPGADGIKVLEPNKDILPKYLYYVTQYLVLRIEDKGYARHYQHIEKRKVDIPDKQKQELIVAKIEEMLSQFDDGVETRHKVKKQLKVYRQAVLKEAFSNLDKKDIIRNVSSIVTSGSRGWAKYYSDSGARFIRITDLTRDKIILQNDSIQRVNLPENVEGKRSKLEANDVLVWITADLGSITLIPTEIEEAYINQHIAMIRFNNSMQGEFMAWYLKSDYGQKDLLSNKRGGGKLGLGLDDIRDTPVPLVTDEIANESVERIDRKMSVCDSIEQTVEMTLQQAKALRQSMLKKAFEGEI